jgi:hypothetical protein
MPRCLALTVVSTVAALAATACQSYDLEPVNPLAIRTVHVTSIITAQKAKPDLMLMVDRSLSMDLPIDPADTRCPSGCGTFGNPCPASCPTRWTELTAAMNDFLTQYGGVARMGLAPFAGVNPNRPSDQCFPGSVSVPTSQSSDVPAELQATAAAINGQIAALDPSFGTPTGPTLEGLRAYAPLANPDRDDYVLLLTDGLPNCNPNNPNDHQQNPAACRCTAANVASCDIETKLFCLDQDNTVDQIGALRDQGVKTVVVGFSSETAAGDGPAVLSAMGNAGGYKLTCPHGLDSECAGGTCNLGDQTCTNSYYQTSDRPALSAALARLAETLDPEPCKFDLPLEPSNEKFISVVVDGVAVARGSDTWEYHPPQEILLVGSLCARAMATTTLSPMDLQIGVIQTF